MPFVVEQERSGTNWFLLLGILFGLGFVALAAYYLFFGGAPLIETLIPARSQLIVEITQSKLDPNTIISNPAYKSLKEYTLPLDFSGIGRANPFIQF